MNETTLPANTLILASSRKKANPPFASTSSVREFIKDDRQAICEDPKTSPRIQKLITTGNFQCLSWCTGGFAQQGGDPNPTSILSYTGALTPTQGVQTLAFASRHRLTLSGGNSKLWRSCSHSKNNAIISLTNHSLFSINTTLNIKCRMFISLTTRIRTAI